MESNELGLLAIKAESSYGTDPVPTTAANIIPVERGTLDYKVQSTAIDRRALDGGFLPLIGFNSLPNVELKFRYEVRGNRTNGIAADISSGLVGNKIEIDALLAAANLEATYTAETTGGARDGRVSYSPKIFASTVGPSVTCYWWTALKLHKLLGGKATFNLVMEAGRIPVLEFTVRGKYSAVTDVSLPSSATWLDTKPQVWEGGVSLINSHNPVHTRLNLDLGNEIVMRVDPNQSDAVNGFVIADTQPKGSMDPESVLEASNPFWADWRSSAIQSLSAELQTGSGQSGNRFRVQCLAEAKSVNYANRDKLRAHDYQFNVVKQLLSTTAANALAFRWS